jgi:hypothetical protein
MLLGLIDTAKGATSGEGRIRRRHPLCDELVFEQRQVRADLARQLMFGAAVPDQGPQTQEEQADGGHHSRPLFLPECDDRVDGGGPTCRQITRRHRHRCKRRGYSGKGRHIGWRDAE